jgi:hypothetical protein
MILGHVWRSICLLGFGLAASAANASTDTPNQSQACAASEVPAEICDYFSAIEIIFRRGSTENDVERLFELVSEDVRYIHETYEAEFERDPWREAFLRNVRSSSYSEPADFCIRVTNFIPGNGYAAVEYEYGRTDSNLCVARGDGRMLALFATRDGKIRLIRELW